MSPNDDRNYGGTRYELRPNPLRRPETKWMFRWIVYVRKPGQRTFARFGFFRTKKAAWIAVEDAERKPHYWQPSLF